MGVYNDTTFANIDISEKISRMAEYLNEMEGVSAEVYEDTDHTQSWGTPLGVKFEFVGSGIEAFFGYLRDKAYIQVWVKNNGEYIYEYFWNHYIPAGANTRLITYIDENFSLISFKDLHEQRGGLEVALSAIDSKQLVGYASWASSDQYRDISSLIFEETTDPARVALEYTNMFPYAAPAGTLDFLNQAYFVNGSSVKKFTNSFLKECSTVNLLSSASLPDPLGNYIALGAHCLAPLDEEGGNT